MCAFTQLTMIRRLDPLENLCRPSPKGKYDKPYKPRMNR